MEVGRNAPPVILDSGSTLGGDRYVNARATAGHGLVNAVVDDFFYQLVEAVFARIANVHSRALAHPFKPFENLYGIGCIFLLLRYLCFFPRKISGRFRHLLLLLVSTLSDWFSSFSPSTTFLPSKVLIRVVMSRCIKFSWVRHTADGTATSKNPLDRRNGRVYWAKAGPTASSHAIRARHSTSFSLIPSSSTAASSNPCKTVGGPTPRLLFLEVDRFKTSFLPCIRLLGSRRYDLFKFTHYVQ